MKDSDVKIGMKVVPHDKTSGRPGLENSDYWKRAKEAGQPYLFVIGDVDLVWALSDKRDAGGLDTEFFRASDFEPYHRALDSRIAKSEAQTGAAD